MEIEKEHRNFDGLNILIVKCDTLARILVVSWITVPRLPISEFEKFPVAGNLRG